MVADSQAVAMAHKWTLGQRAGALVVIVVVVMGLIAAGATAAATGTRRQLNTLLDQIGPLRLDAEQLLSTLVDQETAVRGYALNRQQASLDPYHQGVAEEQRLVGAMERLLVDRPAILAQVRGIEDQANGWRQAVAEPAITALGGGTSGTDQALGGDAARTRFDALRAAVGALQQSLQNLRDDISRRARQSTDTLMTLLIAAAAVVLLAGAALLLLLRTLVTRPVIDLAGQVRLVVDGGYQHEISVDGPPELVRLARDVNAMRRKIAADLGELEAKAAELGRSNRDLEQFAYVASHDLQEPLRKVASFCQLLKRRYAGQLDERADQYINFAVDGAQRMQRLINDLLAFSRIGRVTSGFVDIDLNALMGDTVEQLDSVRQRTGAQITWSELPLIRGEEPLLGTLLANLIGNSLKFRRPGQAPRVHVSARRTDDAWEITCADNGIGIEPEFADKVFIIFQRLHGKDAYPGTGIGLAIAKKIVEYHGGHIWVVPVDANADTESGSGTGGTAIRFTLPVTVPAVADPSEADETGTQAAAPRAPEPADDSAKETLV
jgi:signal transduction histidine kinase